MTLESYRTNGWLHKHQSSTEEIRNLLGVADTKISDYQKAKALSADSRVSLAHNAIMASAIAVLAAAGYRTARGGSEHYHTIEALEFTIDPERKLIRRLDAFRKKRNQSTYEVSGSVSDMEAEHGFALALQVRAEAEKWIKTNRPELVA
jgi:hypothetical protein